MRLSTIHANNFKSIVDSGEIRIEPFQVLVGENNVGKSNLLKAIDIFLTSGSGGVQETDFFDPSQPIIITCTFTNLSSEERKRLRPYLLGDKLTLEKHIFIRQDEKTNKLKVNTEYHGYIASPKEWWLSVEGVIEEKGSRPKWQQIANEHGILEYVQTDDGKVNKKSYSEGIRQLLQDREDIEYEEPVLGETQALGLQPVLLDALPRFYLLPAITDYSSEIDRRSTTTVFRRLMGDLSERIMKTDPRYNIIESALETISKLLNPPESEEQEESRLEILKTIEDALRESISKLMPSVRAVQLKVNIDDTKEIFSRGVDLKIDDGVLTDVLDKGHGMQRSVVFGLLQTLIKNQKGQLLGAEGDAEKDQGMIILGIEEPELYIHPQAQRLIFKVLKEFAQTDQAIYSTHAPAFIDISDFHCIGIVRKESVLNGTRVHQCDECALDDINEKKRFQFLNSFGIEPNEMFFANRPIFVEGKNDKIAIIAAGRELGLFDEFPEEIGAAIIICSNKEEIPKYQKILNKFEIPYNVWLELDGESRDENTNGVIMGLLNNNRCIEIPLNLEALVGHEGHFSKTYDAMKYFENPDNITEELKEKVAELFEGLV